MLIATLNLNTLAAVSLAASTEDTRFYLQGVCVEITPERVTYTATNGHMLLAASGEENTNGDGRNTLCGTFIIPTEICRGFKVKKGASAPFVTGVLSAGSVEDFDMTLKHLDSDTGKVFKRIDGTFPDWRRVVPGATATAFEPLSAATFAQARDNEAPQFNPVYLETMRKFGEKMGAGLPHVHYGDKSSPAPITFGHVEAFGIVMPVRNEADGWAVPSWVRPFQAEQVETVEEQKAA